MCKSLLFPKLQLKRQWRNKGMDHRMENGQESESREQGESVTTSERRHAARKEKGKEGKGKEEEEKEREEGGEGGREKGRKERKVEGTGEDVEVGALVHCKRECEMVRPLWTAAERGLQTKHKITMWTNDSILGVPIQKKWKLIAKTWKQSKCPWTDDGYRRCGVKNNEILPFAATWMGWEGIRLSELSQTEKDKYCIISLTYGILKNTTN